MKLRLPLIYNLRRDPFERADFNSNIYFDWMVDHIPQMYLMQATVAAQIDNFVKFPPRQKPASFNLDAVLGAGIEPWRACPDRLRTLSLARRANAASSTLASIVDLLHDRRREIGR